MALSFCLCDYGDISMKKVAILYIALGRYIVFWRDFYESCERYLGNCDKHYFIWTDNTEFDYSTNPNVTVIRATRRGWPYDTLMRFHMFMGQEQALKKFDYIYFFNANMQFINPVDLTEIVPREWNDGLVAGSHPGRWGDTRQHEIDAFPYERRSESTAYIPYGTGQYYVCGAFNGGTAEAYLKMCRTLAKNVQTDLDKNIVACVDDESHLNAYMRDKNFLLCDRAYGFPEGKLKQISPIGMPMVKIISRHKDSPKYGGIAWLRGKTDKKMPNTWFTRHVMRAGARVVAIFILNRKLRQTVRSYYG